METLGDNFYGQQQKQFKTCIYQEVNFCLILNSSLNLTLTFAFTATAVGWSHDLLQEVNAQ